jgi:hypothetical protein
VLPIRRQPVAFWSATAAALATAALFALYWLDIGGVSSTFAERLRLSRAMAFTSAAAIGLVARWRWDDVRRLLRAFWYGSAHPMNLAIYRIALFATIAWDPDVDYDRARVVFFSTLPHELRIDLPLMGWITQNVPVNPTLAAASCTLLRVFSITAMIGLFSRTSAALVTIIGLYALGVPQLFGQTNHYHHMIWFAAILATSRCGDFLSVDAILSASRSAGRGLIVVPRKSRAYALPLRFVWLLMGLIYLFPGLWKYWRSGLDWAFSDNFRNQLHLKWMQLDGWTPFFRIDEYPLLCQLGALGALVFELTFILFIFFPRWRWVPAVWGLAFHNLTYLLMRIAFITLQTSYVSLFDWRRIFGRLGRWMFPTRMTVSFDARSGLSRRVVAVARTVDLLGRIDFVRGGADVAGVRVVVRDRSAEGIAAVRWIVHRLPVLWPILPLLYIWPTSGLTRWSEAQPSAGPPVAMIPLRPSPYPRAVVALGVFLLVGNFIFGVKEERRGWPLTCYPPFSRILGEQTHVFHMAAIDAQGNEIAWDERRLLERFSSPRYVSLLRHLHQRNDAKQFDALWRVACRYDPALKHASSVRFYDETLWTAPDRQGENPVERRLLFESRLDGLAAR